jgi:putative ABC transport system ATP-binding protein
MAPYVTFENVAKVYRTEGEAVHALHDVNFSIEQGEVCVIVGQSGAGKTTLLNILGGMDTLTSGKAFLGGEEISAYNKRQLTRYRREDVGFVFQFYNLIPNLTALENVEMATELAKTPFSAAETLKDVGLGERMSNFPAQLSGGEQQRVAIARALAKNPKLLLCDEPTGALDDSTGKQVLKVLSDLGRVKGKTVVIITHNSAITQMADRVVRVKNGTVVSVQTNEHPKSVEEIDW